MTATDVLQLALGAAAVRPARSVVVALGVATALAVVVGFALQFVLDIAAR
jgi:NADH-quinone oxidoreductase subunit N